MSNVRLPKICRVRLTGFEPIFRNPIEFSPPTAPGPFMILGGNGLGKTTILQATVFGLAGPADDTVQPDREDKRFTWTPQFFKERLDNATQAEVQVEFELGEQTITVRRGMDSTAVRGIKLADGTWQNTRGANELYEAAILDAGNYRTIEDFRFLVHRLAYLPESRQNLVWHAEAQMTIFLLIAADSESESEIRRMALDLKKYYNEMRHLHVSLGHLQKRLARATKQKATKGPKRETEKEISIPAQQDLNQLDQELSSTNKSIGTVLSELEEVRGELMVISTEIEAKEDHMAACEEQFVLRRLQEAGEAREALALHKMVVSHHCPYCAQKNDELAVLAADRMSRGQCPVCGLDHIHATELPARERRREDLMGAERKRSRLLKRNMELQKELSALREKDARLRSSAATLEFRLPRVTARDKLIAGDDVEALRSNIAAYDQDHRRWKTLHDDQKARIEQRYAKLAASQARTFQLLEDKARDYATAFLGVKCSFVRARSVSVDRNIRFEFPVLVPRFGDKERTNPQQCSESQAFFLDIAFRIAVIEVANSLSGHAGTFVSETPENALDLAYAENVAEMFTRFSKAGGFTLMTANIQAGGVAEPLLGSLKSRAERSKRVFNLLNHAELSVVQSKKRPKLEEQLHRLLDL